MNVNKQTKLRPLCKGLHLTRYNELGYNTFNNLKLKQCDNFKTTQSKNKIKQCLGQQIVEATILQFEELAQTELNIFGYLCQ